MDHLQGGTGAEAVGAVTDDQLYAAAQLYYQQEATQAEVAASLGTSRATVSRWLNEARRRGIVQIQVLRPARPDADDLADRVSAFLKVQQVYLSAPVAPVRRAGDNPLGRTLAAGVGRALEAVGLRPGDALLVSSGRTIYEVAKVGLPRLPGVVVVPTVGGNDQPEAWYQTNAITRIVADSVGGKPTNLFAPALPGPDMYATLRAEPSIQRVLDLWPLARCALIGIGAPPLLRADLPAFVPVSSPSLRDAVGDVCARFFDRDGAEVGFSGSDRLLSIELATLKTIPTVIAVAAGQHKVTAIVAGARAGYFNQLVTDTDTARHILAA